MTDNTTEPIDPLANIPIVFDPNIAALQAIADSTKDITATDHRDSAKMALVKEARQKLVKARTTIEKLGKKMRDGSNAFNKRVITEEDRLIAIIEPEELRLKAIEAEAAALALKEERMALLPERRERLKPYMEASLILDEVLCDLDNIQFEAFFNTAVAMHNESVAAAVKAEQDAKQAALDAQQKQIDEEKQRIKDADDKRIRDEQEAKDKKEQEEREKVAVEERAAKALIARTNARFALLSKIGFVPEGNGAHFQLLDISRIDVADVERLTDEEFDTLVRPAEVELAARAKRKIEEDERIANETRAAAEKAAIEKREQEQARFKEWRASFGYTEESKDQFKLFKNANGTYSLCKVLGTFLPESN